MIPALRRSNAPIFWVLFGAGGMLAALIGPMLVIITGWAGPLGIGLPTDAMDYANMRAFSHHLAGQTLVFAVISLLLWHAAHRIVHSLHDFGLHASARIQLLCYGFALLGSVITLAALLSLVA